ncbi:SGNH/GDSL hydrolase family protein [Sinomonas sp. JGH33]|uniref:SGNH/GDSL hydrolase family protein n=1 Tax=Sinomonas terricola TaxID=3110330 RepID=A0ABU5T1M8_9MICC|nr:SGNH/GDSL hydrolase family protein [Sinomonas sp. JGH33]MEA5453556.1 SGNH/GDSL hydrolase family protein [Sinomonas sp. JGH33]
MGAEMRRRRAVIVGGAMLALAALGAVMWAVDPSWGRPGMLQAAPAQASGEPSGIAAAGERAWPPVQHLVRFAAIGDSITYANSPDFLGGRTGSLSWITYAVGPDLRFVGGWARGGATTEVMAANAGPEDADVLAIIAGTNDVARNVPFSVTAANLEKIVATVGARRVVVSAIPPRNDNAQGTEAFNEALELFVAQRGWTFVDAVAGVRDGERYAAGMSDDGVHPSEEGARIIGTALGQALM